METSENNIVSEDEEVIRASEQITPHEMQLIKKLEEEIVKKLEKKAELEKLAIEARAELESIDVPGTKERRLLMFAAAIMIVMIPLLHYLLAIVLALFVILISVLAGLTSPKQIYSARLNLFISTLGTLVLEYSAIYEFHANGAAGLFWANQFLALVFLFTTYFSVETYRKKILERK